MDGVSADTVSSLIDYDDNSGLLFWKPRGAVWFRDSYRSAEGNAANWNAHYAGTEALACLDGHGYKSGRIFGRLAKAHRVAWILHNGEWPNMIDHINGDKLDNRIGNLRSVTAYENNRNLSRRISNKSGTTGVCWDAVRCKWLATISGRHIGRFDDIDAAISARLKAAADQGYHDNHGRHQ